MPETLSAEAIRHWSPYPLPAVPGPAAALAHARERMQRNGQWADWQMVGRRMAIGCVALEITQRCNLDCSYCYLSESSEALKDIPIEEVLRRIDLIHQHYGPVTDVQVTGGEPTLRKREELLRIVAYIRSKGMRSSLFTNGIKATRELLEALCAAGLEDVAFHVDMTQQRAGYANEAALNRLRAEYIERARGLPLGVMFNTTAFHGNFDELPALVRFFIQHHDVVRLASFQIGADTGRGAERARDAIDTTRVAAAINSGAGTRLNFDAASAGHADCNRYAYGLVLNGRLHDFFNEPGFVREILADSAHIQFDRADTRRTRLTIARYLLRHPGTAWGAVRRLAAWAWRQRRDVLAARGRVGKLSFFIHNFMDAKALDAARCDACSFMVMTPEGPISMCVHNAKRDDYLLVPARVQRESRVLFFNPATGLLQPDKPQHIGVTLTRKNARGRAKPGHTLMLDEQAPASAPSHPPTAT